MTIIRVPLPPQETSLEKSYPYLVTWKCLGPSSLPTSPFPPMTQEDLEEHRRRLEETRTALAAEWRKNDPNVERIERDVAKVIELLEKNPPIRARKHFRENMLPKARQYGMIVLSILNIYEHDPEHSRELALDLFAKQCLPNRRGGKIIHSEDRKNIIKSCYDEMREFIGKARKRHGIENWDTPRAHKPNDDQIEIILQKDSAILELFYLEEAPLLFEKLTPATISKKIIVQRISSITSKFSEETLNNILYR